VLAGQAYRTVQGAVGDECVTLVKRDCHGKIEVHGEKLLHTATFLLHIYTYIYICKSYYPSHTKFIK
jgi:hypothetical protein